MIADIRHCLRYSSTSIDAPRLPSSQPSPVFHSLSIPTRTTRLEDSPSLYRNSKLPWQVQKSPTSRHRAIPRRLVPPPPPPQAPAAIRPPVLMTHTSMFPEHRPPAVSPRHTVVPWNWKLDRYLKVSEEYKACRVRDCSILGFVRPSWRIRLTERA